MNETHPSTGPASPPDLSVVVPAYNEEAILASTLNRLLEAFQKSGIRLELVVVDNGSHDRTGAIAAEFAARTAAVRPVRVPVNRGYGYGILQGIPHCAASWIGILPADGQVDAEDMIRLFEAVQATDGRVLAKARRRFRLDGLKRKVVSVAYNLLVVALWPRIGSWDINGLPKIMHRDVARALELASHDWFLDPEIMIKSHELGIRVLELNVFSRMRSNGLSHVRPSTCWEFFRSLIGYRISGGKRREWRLRARRELQRPAGPAPRIPDSAAVGTTSQ